MDIQGICKEAVKKNINDGFAADIANVARKWAKKGRRATLAAIKATAATEYDRTVEQQVNDTVARVIGTTKEESNG